MGTTKKKDLMTETGDEGSIRISLIMPLPMLRELRALSEKDGIGYQTLIKEIISNHLAHSNEKPMPKPASLDRAKIKKAAGEMMKIIGELKDLVADMEIPKKPRSVSKSA